VSPPPGLPPLAAEDHACAGCGIDYTSVTADAARTRIALLPDRYAAAVRGAPDETLRRRPAPAVWSAVEYLCHVRDVYATFTIRLHRARAEDRPALEPMFADLRAERFGYNRYPVDAVLAELAAVAAGFTDEVADTRPGEWGRVVTRLPQEERTALWLARQALHEGVHHLHDVERILR
jgi:DinB superfamily